MKFDAKGFSCDKELLLMQETGWQDHDSNKALGVKLKVVIWTDDTAYSTSGVRNEGSELDVKILRIKVKEVNSDNSRLKPPTALFMEIIKIKLRGYYEK